MQEWLESENTEALNKDHALLMGLPPFQKYSMTLDDVLGVHVSRTHQRLAIHVARCFQCDANRVLRDNGIEDDARRHMIIKDSIVKWWNARQESAATK